MQEPRVPFRNQERARIRSNPKRVIKYARLITRNKGGKTGRSTPEGEIRTLNALHSPSAEALIRSNAKKNYPQIRTD